jgi:hypothetical protein
VASIFLPKDEVCAHRLGRAEALKEVLDMASKTKSKSSASRALARCCLLGSLLVLSAPSWAGRDAGQMIAQDKANKDVIARRQAALNAAASTPQAANEVLPLDHGPRATTTPWLNAQRRLHERDAAASAPAVDAMGTPGTASTK